MCWGYGDDNFEINDFIALSWPTISSKVSGLKKLIIFLLVTLESNSLSSSYFFFVFWFSLPFSFFIMDNLISSIYFSCFSIIAFSTLDSIWLWIYFLAISSEIQPTASSRTSSIFSSGGTTSIPAPSEAIILSA